MSCSSACPCLYCPTRKVKGVWPSVVETELRTVGGIRRSCEEWLAAGGRKEKAKEFENSVAMPLIAAEDEDDVLLLVKLPPPALHLKLGFNHLVNELYLVINDFIEKY